MVDTSTVVLVLRVTLSLACVLGIIWFAGRRMAGTAAVRRQRAAAMSVVARQSLGGRNGLAVVDVAGRRLLLGTGEKGVTLLTELDPPEPEPAVTVREERVPLTHEDLADLAGATDLPDLVDVDGVEIPADASSLTPEGDHASAPRPVPSSTPAARMPAVTEPRNPLEGSILDAATWRRAVVAVQERTIRR